LPVANKVRTDPEGGARLLKLNWETLAFEYGYEYLERIILGTSPDLESRSKEEFMQYVESLRARRYKKKMHSERSIKS
jgi:hypothetical protein